MSAPAGRGVPLHLPHRQESARAPPAVDLWDLWAVLLSSPSPSSQLPGPARVRLCDTCHLAGGQAQQAGMGQSLRSWAELGRTPQARVWSWSGRRDAFLWCPATRWVITSTGPAGETGTQPWPPPHSPWGPMWERPRASSFTEGKETLQIRAASLEKDPEPGAGGRSHQPLSRDAQILQETQALPAADGKARVRC